MTAENNNVNNIENIVPITTNETTAQNQEDNAKKIEEPVNKPSSNVSEGYVKKPRFEKKYVPKHNGGGTTSHEKEPSSTYRRPDHKSDQMQRMPKFKKKLCRFCLDSDLKIDYKSGEILGRFITDRGKILPRRVTGTCAKHQRDLSNAIKRARIIALIPYIEK